MQERIQIVADALVEAVEFAALGFGKESVTAEWRQQSCGEGGVDSLEQLEEHHADGVALADQSVTTGMRIFSTRPLAHSLERSYRRVASEYCDSVRPRASKAGPHNSAVVNRLPAAMLAKRTRACMTASCRG